MIFEASNVVKLFSFVKNSVEKQVWKPNNRKRNAGLMESLGLHSIHTGETERVRERESERLYTK